jgi:DNA recombination protein RmuC
VNVIWLAVSVSAASGLVAVAALLSAWWQLRLRLRLELQSDCAHLRSQLQAVQVQRNQLEQQLHELSAGLRAEKAHVAQLRRQLQLASLQA